MLTITYNEIDFLGVFGKTGAMVKQDICPTGVNVMIAVYMHKHGCQMDAFDKTLIDLLLAGF